MRTLPEITCHLLVTQMDIMGQLCDTKSGSIDKKCRDIFALSPVSLVDIVNA